MGPSQDDDPPSRQQVISKDFRQILVNEAVDKLLKAQESNGGRLPYGKMSEIIGVLSNDFGVVVTRNVMNKFMKQRQLSEKPLSQIAIHSLSSGSDLSSLSSGSAQSVAESDGQSQTSSRKPGRPAGSTSSNKMQEKAKRKKCITSIAIEYAELMSKREEGSKLPRGTMERLVQQKKQEFGLSDSTISSHTIKSRLKRRRLAPPHPGTLSPLAAGEEAMVQMFIQMARIRQPLSVTDAISLINSLIEGKPIQQKLVMFKEIRNLGQADAQERRKVGKGYWQGFMKRHGHRLQVARGRQFGCNRSEWTKLSYITQMYEEIYREMVRVGVAKRREESVWLDKQGNVVSEESPDKFGLPTDIEVTYPEYILFADETGCNTSQKKDGHISGTKFVVPAGSVPQRQATETDYRFTLLPFTSGSGEAVFAVIIFQSKQKQVPIRWQTGIDVTVDPICDENGKVQYENMANYGPGKHFPSGPTCSYQGKDIPCATFCSESGGITASILVKVLEIIDSLQIMPRNPGGPIPFLLIDGHQSRLDPQFIEYINSEPHKWGVCLGVPYATSLWQVGDSSEQNGTFKHMWYKAKHELLQFKIDHNLPRTITNEDVMPILNRIFPLGYGNTRRNKKATADRGWNPANKALMLHPDLVGPLQSEPSASASVQQEANITLPGLNYSEGHAGQVMELIIAERMKNGGIEARKKKLAKGEAILTRLKASKTLTAGGMVNEGIHTLGHPVLQQYFVDKRVDSERRVKAEEKKRRKAIKDKIDMVTAIRGEKGNDFTKWSFTECATYLQFKKQDEDPSMPKKVAARRQRCIEISGRKSPTVSPHASDNEEEEELEGFHALDEEDQISFEITGDLMMEAASTERDLPVGGEEQQEQGSSTPSSWV